MKRSQVSLLLELLADGQWHSGLEAEEVGAGHRPNSRAADLRRAGYEVRWSTRKDAAGTVIHGYELVAVPLEAPAIERTLGEPARADLEVLRRTRPSASYPTERAEASKEVTTPEVGDSARARSGPRDGGHGQGCGTEGTTVTAGAEARHESNAAGGIPGSAPAAVDAAVAQLVERDVANVEVAGSTPASRFTETLPPPPVDVLVVERDVRELGLVEDELASLEATCGLTFEELERLAVLEGRRSVLESRLGRAA